MDKRTVHLSEEDAATLEAYAREQGLTVDEVLHRFVASLRRTETADIHPDVHDITGLVPSDVDAEDEYGRHQLRKHDS